MSWNRPPTAKSPHAWAEKCPTAKPNRLRDGDEKLRQLYKSAAWERFRTAHKACNPICQRIVNGEQCHHPGKIAHHVISPRIAPQLVYDWRIVVMVCTEHHPDTPGEDPRSAAPNVYAITHGLFGATYDVNELIARLRNPLTVGVPIL